jgi:hypothetical protein
MKTLLGSGLGVGLMLVLAAGPVAGQAKPGPEHKMLKKFEGVWDATVSFTGGTSKATARYEVGMGGFWLQLRFKGEFGGAPFEGRGVTGYDPHKKKFVSTWVDSMEPTLLVMQGNFAKNGKTYTETGNGYGMDGKPQKMKSVYEFKGKNTILFTMYKLADGKEEQQLQITYKRKKK